MTRQMKISLWVIFILIITFGIFVALPNFIRAHSQSATNACINNLRLIDAAKQQWALEYNKSTNDVPTWKDIQPFLSGKIPVCPNGGIYTLGKVGVTPTCSIGGLKHSLSE